MNKNDFIRFIANVNNDSNNKGYLIEQLPGEFYLRKPQRKNDKNNLLVFNDKIPQIINKRKINHILKYINTINHYLQEQGFILRETTYSSEEYILTLDFSHNLSLLIQKVTNKIDNIFSGQKIGYCCSLQEIRKNEYDVEISSEILNKAVENVNSMLIDRKIIIDTEKESLRYINNSDNTTEKCPICKEPFSVYGLKQHFLQVHTYGSALTVGKGGRFHCMNCGKKELVLYDERVKMSVIMAHFNGECKNPSFGNSRQHVQQTNEKNEVIWTGAAYSNDERFLGNSRQIYRDWNGFGSTPLEDNYSDGDKNF